MALARSILFILLIGVGVAQAQNGGGAVTGQVKDSSGAVIPNATVTLTSDSGQAQTAQSKSDGTYTFRSVPPGTYTVSATYKGLAQNGVVVVQVTGGQIARGDLLMKPAEVTQEITVQENPNQVSVDPSQNADALVIKGADLEALPDDPDDLQQDLQALAGPSAGPNGGEIYVDGFSSGRLPPKDSIREIRINQNPFSSEYDKLGFGRIEIFTKPGSDKFHGTAFYDTSQGFWNSRNPFITSSPFPNFQLQNYGGNVSGPVNKHASFFFDFERRQIDDNGILNAIVLNLDTDSGQRPRLHAHPSAAHDSQPKVRLATRRQQHSQRPLLLPGSASRSLGRGIVQSARYRLHLRSKSESLSDRRHLGCLQFRHK